MNKKLLGLVGFLAVVTALLIFLAQPNTPSDTGIINQDNPSFAPIERPRSATDPVQNSGANRPNTHTNTTPNFPVTHAPGGIYEFEQYQYEHIVEVIQKSQHLPVSAEPGQDTYIVADTPSYSVHITTQDGIPLVEVVLKREPLYDARAEAESVFAFAFEGERADLCGFPFMVRTTKDHSAYERGNLGLEHCGANKLGEDE